MTTITDSTIPAGVRQSRSMGKTIKLWLRYVPLVILVFFFTFPLIFMIVSSFKGSNQQIFGDLRSLRAFLPVGELTSERRTVTAGVDEFRVKTGADLFRLQYVSVLGGLQP